MAGQIAVVGPKDAVLAFRALGVTVAPAQEPEAVSQAIFRLAKEGYAVIFVTEEEAEGAREMIARFAAEPLPAIIPIPGASGANGFWHAGGARQCGKGRRRGHFVGKKGGRVNQCGRESLRRSPAR